MTTLGLCPAFRRANLKPQPSGTAGFSLLELSIVITIIALVVGVSVDMGLNMIESADIVATNHKLNVIEQALESYRLGNERLPCPADASALSTSSTYGTEAGNTGGECDDGTPAGIATYLVPKSTNSINIAYNTYVAEGAVPFKALSLPESFMYDAWGRKFAYAVWTPDAAEGAFLNYGIMPSCGAIRVDDAGGGPRTQSAVYALVSFGPDGHGGYTKAGTRYFSGSDNGNSGAAPLYNGAGEWTNCHCDGTADTGYAATYVQKRWSEDPNDSKDTFDDLVRYKLRWQMTDQHDYFSALGSACTPGFIVSGTVDWASIGAVAIGDVNGDGIPDLIIGGAGKVYIIFGQKGGGYADPYLTSSAPVVLTGPLVSSLAVGDVYGHGNGMQDIIIGSSAWNSNTGSVYVVYGQSTWSYSSYSLDGVAATHGLINGSQGFRLNGVTAGDHFGYSIAAGTIHGGAGADIIAGAPNATANGHANAGKAYVVFNNGMPTTTTNGSTASGSSTVVVNSVTNMEVGQTVYATNLSTSPATTISAINGGTNTLTLSTPTVGIIPSGTPFYVSVATVDSTFLTGSNGFELDGDGGTNSYAGSAIAAGDINNDGMADVVVGQWGSSYNGSGSGSVYVIYGASTWTTPQNLNSLADGTHGFRIDGRALDGIAEYPNGIAVGDINGDNYNDIVIGAPNSNTRLGGVVYTVFGGPGSWPANFKVTALAGSTGVLGTGGFELDAPSSSTQLGYSLAIGDVNGDGKQDIITGDAGAGVHVIFGGSGPKGGGSWPTSPQTLSNSWLSNGGSGAVNGFTLTAPSNSVTEGVPALAVGDITRDGRAEIALGASGLSDASACPGGSGMQCGQAFVVYGKSSYPLNLNLNGL
ncbi:MAG TPA: prepilin-type N-terminal cleavage/methylation domain-containing protein [Pirellulales bacterium]|nr:prepilin-type N-terminal cleavage/methylation domain-containing protein [Pirellulales bacterium]